MISTTETTEPQIGTDRGIYSSENHNYAREPTINQFSRKENITGTHTLKRQRDTLNLQLPFMRSSRVSTRFLPKRSCSGITASARTVRRTETARTNGSREIPATRTDRLRRPISGTNAGAHSEKRSSYLAW
jgi:hypothetical protein